MWPEITPVPYAPDAPTIRRFSWSPSRSSWVIDYSENLQQWIRAQGPPTTTGFRGELGFTVPAGFPRFYIRMVRLQSP